MREGWKRCRLNDVLWFQRGFDLPKEQFQEGEIPVFGSTSILGYHNLSKVNAPGIITGRSGTLGKFQIAKENFWPHNTTLWVKDFKGNDVLFCYYMLQCLDFASLNSGGAVPTLNRNLLNSFVVNLPPLPTQRKIATILSAYDDLIENNLKRIKLLEEKAQLTYEEWFVKMRFPGYETAKFDEVSGLPEGWSENTLEYLCDKITDGTHDSPKQVENGIKLITGKHINDGFINFDTAYLISNEDHEKIKKRSGLSKGDLLFSNIGTLGSIGVVTEDFEYSCKNVVIFKKKDGFDYFLYCYLSNRTTKNKLDNQAAGVAQKFYSLSFIRGYKDIFPNEKLLIKFNEITTPIFKLKYSLNNQNRLLKESRDILLPRLMSGMVDVEELGLAERIK